MSWNPQGQPGVMPPPLQHQQFQQQKPPAAVPSVQSHPPQPVVGNYAPQWNNNYTTQPMHPTQQQQTSWYNANAQPPPPAFQQTPNVPVVQPNWQQQNVQPIQTPNQATLLAPSIPTQPNQVNYFSNPQPLVDNYIQQQQLYSVPTTAHPANNSLNTSTQNFIQSEQMETQGHDLSQANQSATDGWNDWNDWNDNNSSMIGQPQDTTQQQLPAFNQNVIADSFSTQSNDNWQWGTNSGNLQQPSIGNRTNSASDQSQIESWQSNQPPVVAENPPVNSVYSTNVQNVQTVNSVNQQGPAQPRKPSENGVSNSNYANTYSMQAKSVDQPAGQFDGPPATLESIPVISSEGSTQQIAPVSFPQPPRGVPTTVSPPPASQAAPQNPPPPQATPPPASQPPLPPSQTSKASGNPFKRAGAVQHHRAGLVAAPKNAAPATVFQTPQFIAPPPEDFANPGENQEILVPENSEVVDRPAEVENQEIAPNNDRNEYLQTSHLSEEAVGNFVPEQSTELDNFPPPGLSRLVLGQPEIETQPNSQRQETPPDFDRMIPGTEIESDLNLERQADGQDTIPSPRSAYGNVPPVDDVNDISSNIDITTDRNLYLVPGESDIHEQRVVTGNENIMPSTPATVSMETSQREVELDGENLEDQQQQQMQSAPSHPHPTFVQAELDLSSREEPIEGANTLDEVAGNQNTNHETESSLTHDTNAKDLSNASSGNEESDTRDRGYFAKPRRGGEDKKRRPGNETKDRRQERYDTEESELSSDRERRRYREGSVRSDRDKERDSKERRRKDKRDVDERNGDKYRDEKDRGSKRYDRGDRPRDKYDRGDHRGGRYANRYDADSRYETESSTRYERRRGDKERDRPRDRDRDGYRRDDVDRRYKNDKRREDRDDRGDRVDKDYREKRRSERDRERGDDRHYRDDRRHRDRNRSDYEDNYRKTSSRNARESDIDKERPRDLKDPRYAQAAYGYNSAGYGYDAYSYYQHQQYYEQLRRTNPQAYAEWYRKYYGQLQPDSFAATDGRESVHSGRSSAANNEKDRYSLPLQHQQQYIPHPSDYHRHYMQSSNMSATLNSTMIEQQQQHQQLSGGFGLSGGPSTGNLSQINQLPGGGYYSATGRSYYARSEYSETRPENQSLNLTDVGASSMIQEQEQEPARLTPCKFTNSHAIVSLSAGVLVSVKPKYSQNGVTNIVKLFKFSPNDGTRRLFQAFPGPLVRGLTHKKTIIEFCEDQIRLGPPSATLKSRQNSTNSVCSVNLANKASFTLMWNLLILLLRQNGMVVGADIAELLLKNKNQFPYEIPQNVATSNLRRESVQSGEPQKDKEDTPSDGELETEANSNDESDESDSKSLLSEEEITEKFRNYLLYGNFNEALDWATDNNLWGHALFLASKVDRRSHANVMMKFANKLSLNDPLQTLYQLMSGRTPSSVTSVQDEKWGDWRPHLAMILSNTSPKPELDRRSITTLGDSLFNRGDTFGAHFCYLMAQVGFGKYSSVNQEQTFMANSQHAIRLILLGTSHYKTFKEFATNEAIMMTEIYEYACSLNDDKFSIPEFQPYKYLLATRMLDYGYHLKSLMYVEQISLHIQRNPLKYEAEFIEKVYNLADRLKFYDPVLEKTFENQDNIDNEGNQLGGPQFEEQKWLQELRSLLSEQKVNSIVPQNPYNYQLPPTNDYDPTHTQIDQQNTEINQQFAEINRQFNELNLQYDNYDQNSLEPIAENHLGYNSQTQPQQLTDPMQVQQSTAEQPYSGQFYNPNENQALNQDGTPGYGGGYLQPQLNYDGQQQQQLYGGGQDDQLGGSNQQNTFEYSSWSDQQQTNETPRPTISMPNSTSKQPSYFDDDNDGGRGSQGQSVGNSSKSQAGSGAGGKTDSKTQKANTSSNANQNSGWFGGIWNKLSLKPKNQMILPDDKNPSIVWDPEKKKWVNTDGDDNEQENFKPPPKMNDIMGSASPQQQLQPQTQPMPSQSPFNQTTPQLNGPHPQDIATTPGLNQNYNSMATNAPSPANAVGGETSKVPTLQSNMFKMQRNRTLKKSYVDVFNPSGAQPAKPVEPVLAPTLPPAAVPQSGFFIPSPVAGDGGQQQQTQQEVGPQFYNPNQFGGYQQ